MYYTMKEADISGGQTINDLSGNSIHGMNGSQSGVDS